MDEGADGLMADTLITGTTLVEKESRSIGDVPIGGIVSWAKTLAGVPNLAEGWVECDGSVLVDALSPLNGQTIPDLNGDNRFMRGDSTSGGVGGSETMAHTHTGWGTFATQKGGAGANDCLDLTDQPNPVTNGASVTENRPPFYTVVWIMRVR